MTIPASVRETLPPQPTEPDTHPDTGETLRPGCDGCGHEQTLWACTHLVPAETLPPLSSESEAVLDLLGPREPSPKASTVPPNHDPRAVAKGAFPIHNGPAGSTYADGEVIPAKRASTVPDAPGWSLHRLYSVAGTRADTTDERYGQALFNTLRELRPDILACLHGPADPFHAAVGDDRMKRAITVIESMWGGRCTPGDAGLSGVKRDRDSAAEGLARVRGELKGLRERVESVLATLEEDDATLCQFGRGRSSGITDARRWLRAALLGTQLAEVDHLAAEVASAKTGMCAWSPNCARARVYCEEHAGERLTSELAESQGRLASVSKGIERVNAEVRALRQLLAERTRELGVARTTAEEWRDATGYPDRLPWEGKS